MGNEHTALDSHQNDTVSWVAVVTKLNAEEADLGRQDESRGRGVVPKQKPVVFRKDQTLTRSWFLGI